MLCKKKLLNYPCIFFFANKSNLNENNTRRFYFSHTQTSITGTATADSAAVTASSGLKFEQTKNKAVKQKAGKRENRCRSRFVPPKSPFRIRFGV